MLAKACALVLEDYPIVNARYEPGMTVYQKEINVAMAVAIDGGLITPTLKVKPTDRPTVFVAQKAFVSGGYVFLASGRVHVAGTCVWP